ncbi:MAG TPA: hypothetical protein VL086_01190 [Candidatus Nitrosotalea sp.]|nr:hypothetical protein [Candidatus Nitrosotalea sp.]
MAVHRGVEDWLALPLLVFDARVRQVTLGNPILGVGLDGSPPPWLVGRPAPGGSRLERLTAQLREEVADPLDLVIGEVLIGSLDEDGFLAQDLGEIAGALAVEREQVERALRIVQELEPVSWRSAP